MSLAGRLADKKANPYTENGAAAQTLTKAVRIPRKNKNWSVFITNLPNIFC
tara:strand:- start:852 stop:1004 length:153 start_codon:yes stop_codon:yes gene_type:complete